MAFFVGSGSDPSVPQVQWEFRVCVVTRDLDSFLQL